MIHKNLKTDQKKYIFNEQHNLKLFKNIKYPDLKENSEL